MQKVHFKRHGVAGWLELVGLEGTQNDCYQIECHERMTGYQLEMQRVVNSQGIKHRATELNDGVLDYAQAQEEISAFIGWPVELEPFIESYYPSSQFSTILEYNHPGDRDIVNGVDITGMTVAEAVEAADINLADYFSEWKMGKEIDAALTAPSPRIQNMQFTDLYRIIHGCEPKAERVALLLGQNEDGG